MAKTMQDQTDVRDEPAVSLIGISMDSGERGS